MLLSSHAVAAPGRRRSQVEADTIAERHVFAHMVLAVADRVQALASAAAASDRPPMTREVRKNLVMLVVSFWGAAVSGSHAEETGRGASAAHCRDETIVMALSAACNTM